MDDHLKWKEIKTDVLKDCRIFTLEVSDRLSPLGATSDFYILEACDWVTVIPLIKNSEGTDCFLMVKQFRHGNKKVMCEFPAGLVDEDESPEETAGRELIEETGYRAGKLIYIGSTYPCPSFMTNQSHTFLATGLEATGETRFDADEIIESVIIPVDEVASNIREKKEAFCNSQTIVSYNWYSLYMIHAEKQDGYNSGQ
ncbi:MAG: NUDIX hydrolase [Spirochaetales bacterium]|nr:NUDIX hydrolase [Spirochaetales bacterium]